jgi:hypothetical protein
MPRLISSSPGGRAEQDNRPALSRKPAGQLTNASAWALCERSNANGRLRVRKVVWGLMMARYERRAGELILPVRLVITDGRARR